MRAQCHRSAICADRNGRVPEDCVHVACERSAGKHPEERKRSMTCTDLAARDVGRATAPAMKSRSGGGAGAPRRKKGEGRRSEQKVGREKQKLSSAGCSGSSASAPGRSPHPPRGRFPLPARRHPAHATT
jgi:hypothetical protein